MFKLYDNESKYCINYFLLCFFDNYFHNILSILVILKHKKWVMLNWKKRWKRWKMVKELIWIVYLIEN